MTSLDIHPKCKDPCKRPIHRQSLADNFVLLVWCPQNPRHKVEMVGSTDIFGRRFFGAFYVCGGEAVGVTWWGVN